MFSCIRYKSTNKTNSDMEGHENKLLRQREFNQPDGRGIGTVAQTLILATRSMVIYMSPEGVTNVERTHNISTLDELRQEFTSINSENPNLTLEQRDNAAIELISSFLENQPCISSELYAQMAEYIIDIKKLTKAAANVAGGKCATSLQNIYQNQVDREKLKTIPDPEVQSIIDFVPPDVVAMNKRLEMVVREIADPIIRDVFRSADPQSMDTVTHNYSPDKVKVLSRLIKDKMTNQEPPMEFVSAFRDIWDKLGLANKRFIIRSSSKAEDGVFAFAGVGDSIVVPLIEGWDPEERFNYAVRVAMNVFASLFNEAGILARLTNVDLHNMKNFNPANGEFMGALVQLLAHPETEDIAGKSDIEVAKSYISYYCFGDKGDWTVLTALWGNGGAIADSKGSQSVIKINNEVLRNQNDYIISNEKIQISPKKWIVNCRHKVTGEEVRFKEYTIPPQGEALILEEDHLDDSLPMAERWKRYVPLPDDTLSPFDEFEGLEAELFKKLDVTRKNMMYEPDQEGVIVFNRLPDGQLDPQQPIKSNKPVQSRAITGGNERKVEIFGTFPEIPENLREAIIKYSCPVEESFHPGMSVVSKMFTSLTVPTDTSQPLILLAKEVNMEAAPFYKLKGVAAAIESKLTGPTTHGAVTFGESDQPIISGTDIYDLLRLILDEEVYSQFMQLSYQVDQENGSQVKLDWLLSVETNPDILSDLQKQQVDLLYAALCSKNYILCSYQGLPGVEEGNYGGSKGFIMEVNEQTEAYAVELLKFRDLQEENKFNLGKFQEQTPLNKIKFGRNATELDGVERNVRHGIDVNTLYRPNQSDTFTRYKDELSYQDPVNSPIYEQFVSEFVEELYAKFSPMRVTNYRVIAAALEEIWCKNQEGIAELRERFKDDKFSVINGASFVMAYPEIMRQVEMRAIKKLAARFSVEDAGVEDFSKRKIDFTIEFPKNEYEVNWFLQECVNNGMHEFENIELGLTLENIRVAKGLRNIRIPKEIKKIIITLGTNDLESSGNGVNRAQAEGGNKKADGSELSEIEKQIQAMTEEPMRNIQKSFTDQSPLISDLQIISKNVEYVQSEYEKQGRHIDFRIDLCGGILTKNPHLLGHIVKALDKYLGYLNFPTNSKQAEFVAYYAAWLERNYSPETGYSLPEFVELNLRNPEFADALSAAGVW